MDPLKSMSFLQRQLLKLWTLHAMLKLCVIMNFTWRSFDLSDGQHTWKCCVCLATNTCLHMVWMAQMMFCYRNRMLFLEFYNWNHRIDWRRISLPTGRHSECCSDIEVLPVARRVATVRVVSMSSVWLSRRMSNNSHPDTNFDFDHIRGCTTLLCELWVSNLGTLTDSWGDWRIAFALRVFLLGAVIMRHEKLCLWW